jgi:hypothetical protein
VEHSLPSIDAARHWRTATVVASAVAALELVILVATGVALLGKPVAQRVREAATRSVVAPPPARKVTAPAKKKPTAAPKLTRTETSVLVLNGNGRSGAAADAAARVRGLGYVVGGVGNAQRSDYGRSVVMYRPGYAVEAARLARDLHIRVVGPLDGLHVRQLMGAHVAVVLGR